MSDYYTLDENHNAVPVDMGTWATMLEGDFDTNRRVAETTRWPFWISTVFLGLDHNWGDGPPHIFETMIFRRVRGKRLDEVYMERYSTWDEAVTGHHHAVRTLPFIVLSHCLHQMRWKLSSLWKRTIKKEER